MDKTLCINMNIAIINAYSSLEEKYTNHFCSLFTVYNLVLSCLVPVVLLRLWQWQSPNSSDCRSDKWVFCLFVWLTVGFSEMMRLEMGASTHLASDCRDENFCTVLSLFCCIILVFWCGVMLHSFWILCQWPNCNRKPTLQ